MANLATLLEGIASCGSDFSISALDAGASDRVPGLAKGLRRHVSLTLLDPLGDASMTNPDTSYRVVHCPQVALAAQSGTARLHVTRKPQCSSLREPNCAVTDRHLDPERFDVVERIDVPTLSLDDLAEQVGEPFDFVKMDIQGLSGEVLAASRTVIGHATAVAAEIEFVELYKGQMLAGAVMSLMHDLGFDLAALRHKYWRRTPLCWEGQRRGAPIFADALWIRLPEARPQRPVDGRTGAFLAMFFGLEDLAQSFAAADKTHGSALSDVLQRAARGPNHSGAGSAADLRIL
ncbi:MAG: FkbM family methyltransferase [Pseudomonadota bacterium]